MSTHANIIVKTEQGHWAKTYVHHDGYIDHTGAMLAKHYSNDEAAQALSRLGDLSGIGHNVECSVAYYRDRGEDLHRVVRTNIEAEWLRAEYAYVWDGIKWVVYQRGEGPSIIEVRKTK